MAETLSTLSTISFAVAGVCLAIAIFLWFYFKIPTVIGDLSGRTARKSIAKMRAANEKTGAKTYKESRTNAARGKLTGTMPDSEKLLKKNVVDNDQRPETGLLAENRAEGIETEATGVLVDEATGILDAEATGLLIDENATEPLITSTQSYTKRSGGMKMNMLEEVMLIHTNEVIE